MMIRYVLYLAIALTSTGCQQDRTTPRPRAYPRVEYPERQYISYDNSTCPFTFELPAYAVVEEKAEQPCWFDLHMPVFQARLHCSYVPIRNREEFDDLVSDAFTIASQINQRANFMEESRLRNAQGVAGLVLEWTGPAASPMHFFLTDTTHHFFKAALYFEAEIRPDSLKPIADFVREDIDALIRSFTWK
jgi:gliding motility-associated lipoprotein GldD